MAAVLDLSRRSFTNTSEIVKVCRWNNQIEQLFLRDVAVNPRTLWGDETPEQTGDIRAIKEVCPLLKYVDISGCDDSVKELLFSRSLHVQESSSEYDLSVISINLSQELGLEIRDYIQEYSLLRKLLNPSILHQLEVRNQVGEIKNLLHSGVPANCSVKSWTLLHTASVVGETEVCKLLIDLGADCNAKTNEGDTPLHSLLKFVSVVEKRSETVKEICKLFTDLGVNTDVQNNEGDTPLLSFLKYVSDKEPVEAVKEICKLLLDLGANVTKRNWKGETPLHYVAKITREGEATENRSEVCKLLLEHGAESNAKNSQGEVPLHYVLQRGSEGEFTDAKSRMCEVLLDYGANPNARNWKGESPLHYALKRTTEEEIVGPNKEVCASGTDSKVVDYQNDTPMDCDAMTTHTEATGHPSKKCCELLLDHGADSNASDFEGNTPLHIVLNSVSEGRPVEHIKEICKVLLQHGADVNARNKLGETPIVSCIKSGLRSCTNSGCFNQQFEEDKKENEYVRYYSSTVDFCDWLINSGSDVDIRINHSRTLFHLTVQLYVNSVQKNPQPKLAIVVKTLIDCLFAKKLRVTLNSRDEKGNTPLHLLANAPVFDSMLFDCLLEHGCAVNVRNDDYYSPLHLAQNVSFIKTLLQRGAHPNALDDDQNTPLLLFARHKPGIPRLLTSDCWSELFELGMDPLMANTRKETVFSVLLSTNQFDCALQLLSAIKRRNPRNIAKVDTNGDTLLHVACRSCNDGAQEVFEVLLRSGANPNCSNTLGEIPMHILCKRIIEKVGDHMNEAAYFEGTPELVWAVGLLMKFGGDANIPDGSNKTCLEIAKDHGMTRLQGILEMSVVQIDIPPLLPWIQQSRKHRVLLGQVARHQKSKQVERFHYNCQPIGRGAFGFVHVGIDENDGREIAVKRMLLEHLDRPEDRREIQSLSILKDCEQVVKYLGFYKDESVLYIILELMDGNLEDLICPEKWHVSLCKDVVNGLAFLHENRILHRDIKPGNILYKSKPRLCLKLADFGLSAKENPSNLSTQSVMHSTAGTRCWMAPELLESMGSTRYSPATDVFAAGLVLHYILAEKKHVFEPVDEKGMSWGVIQIETERNILDDKLNISPSIPAEAQHLVTRMLHNQGDERPTAADCLSHPYFWTKAKKVQFLCAVGNQPEMIAPRSMAAVRGSSSVVSELETVLGHDFAIKPWDNRIPRIYSEMMSSPKSRRYDTTSAVALLRFFRNAYSSISSHNRPSGFKQELFENFVFFDRFPTLFITVYLAVVKFCWERREEIKYVLGM